MFSTHYSERGEKGGSVVLMVCFVENFDFFPDFCVCFTRIFFFSHRVVKITRKNLENIKRRISLKKCDQVSTR